MIHSITITNYLGDSLFVDLRRPEISGFLFTSMDGIGSPTATIHTSSMSINDGSIYNSAVAMEKNITLGILFQETTKGESIEDVRLKTYKFFPIKKEVTLTIVTDNRSVMITGRVETNVPSIFTKQAGAQISILCPDPYFYSTESHITNFYGIDSMFEFPFSNESLTEPLLEFGTIQNKTENIIHYEGDASVGLYIMIHALGPVENITIYNMDTREKIFINTDKLEALTGEGIIKSDDIFINTSKFQKSAILLRGGEEINILNCLGKDIDWFTLVKGDNTFAFVTDSGYMNLQFNICNKIRYEGV